MLTKIIENKDLFVIKNLFTVLVIFFLHLNNGEIKSLEVFSILLILFNLRY
jgi:hypothetical protein